MGGGEAVLGHKNSPVPFIRCIPQGERERGRKIDQLKPVRLFYEVYFKNISHNKLINNIFNHDFSVKRT